MRSTNGSAKFEIKDGVRLIESTLKPKELKLAEYVLEENLENIQEAWQKIPRGVLNSLWFLIIKKGG